MNAKSFLALGAVVGLGMSATADPELDEDKNLILTESQTIDLGGGSLGEPFTGTASYGTASDANWVFGYGEGHGLKVDRCAVTLLNGTYNFAQLLLNATSEGDLPTLTIGAGATLNMDGKKTNVGNNAMWGVAFPSRIRVVDGGKFVFTETAGNAYLMANQDMVGYLDVEVSGEGSSIVVPKETSWGGSAFGRLVVADGGFYEACQGTTGGSNGWKMDKTGMVLAVTNGTFSTAGGKATTLLVSGSDCLISVAGANAHLNLGQMTISGSGATFAFKVPAENWSEAPIQMCWKVTAKPPESTTLLLDVEDMGIPDGESRTIPLMKTVQGFLGTPYSLNVVAGDDYESEFLIESNILKVKVTKVSCKHVWSDWVIDPEPKCVLKGKKTRTCENCHSVETEDIPATGIHTYDDEGVCTSCGKVRGAPALDENMNSILTESEEFDLRGTSVGDIKTYTEVGTPDLRASAEQARDINGHCLWIEGADVTFKNGTYNYNQLELVKSASGSDSSLTIGEGATLAMRSKECSTGDPNCMWNIEWSNANARPTLKVLEGGTLDFLALRQGTAGTLHRNVNAGRGLTFIIDGGTVNGKLLGVGGYNGVKDLEILNGSSLEVTRYTLDYNNLPDSAVTVSNGTFGVDNLEINNFANRASAVLSVAGENGSITGGTFTANADLVRKAPGATLKFEIPEKGWKKAPMSFTGAATIAEGALAVTIDVTNWERGKAVPLFTCGSIENPPELALTVVPEGAAETRNARVYWEGNTLWYKQDSKFGFLMMLR